MRMGKVLNKQINEINDSVELEQDFNDILISNDGRDEIDERWTFRNSFGYQ